MPQNNSIHMLILAPIDWGNAFHIDALGSADAEGNTNIPYFSFCRELARRQPAELERLERLLSALKDAGFASLGEQARRLKDSRALWELRTRRGTRLFWFFGTEERTIICLGGYRKQGQKTPKREIEKALAWKAAYERAIQSRRKQSQRHAHQHLCSSDAKKSAGAASKIRCSVRKNLRRSPSARRA